MNRVINQKTTSILLSNLKAWYVWVGMFIGIWSLINSYFETWDIILNYWHMSLAMALGSFVAGSTPMGGGTVGFPILVLLKDSPAELGRNFGFLIQSIGMTSATIFMLCRGIMFDRKVLLWSLPFAMIGLIIGTYYIIPIMNDEYIKIIFSSLWFSFAILTLLKNKEFCAYSNSPLQTAQFKKSVGILVGLTGGITSSLTGVGIDMILYVALVLLYRNDIKIAIATSIIIMSLTSILGTLLHFYIGDLTKEVFHNWLAASPIVLLGAPLGALIVSKISKVYVLYFVSLLCVVQFIWTLTEVHLSGQLLVFISSNLFVAFLLFSTLYSIGKKISSSHPITPVNSSIKNSSKAA